MEGQTQTAPPNGSTPPPSDGGGTPSPDKLFEASDSEYAHARNEHIAKHGPGSWEKHISGLVESASKPAPKTNGEGKPNGATAPAPVETDEEPGEIEINADGKAYEKGTGRFVPKSAYLRVKEAEKTAKSEAQEYRGKTETLRDQLIAAKERLSILTEAGVDPQAKPTTAEPDKPINPKEDLFGAVEHLLKKIESLEKNGEKTANETRAQLEARDLHDFTLSDARAFSAKNPEFQAALTHAVAVQEKSLVALGVDPAEAKAAVKGQMKELIAKAKADKASWCERIFAYAKAVGFTGAPPPSEGETETEKAAREEIERITNGQAASHSLRGAGGNGVGEVLTRSKVSELPDAEYAQTKRAYIAKNGKDAWERFMFGNG